MTCKWLMTIVSKSPKDRVGLGKACFFLSALINH